MEITDYRSLPRRRLQILCKQHGIPANTTNLAMATALDALLNGASTESNVSGVSEVVDCSSGDEIRTPVRKSAAGVKKQATTTRKSRVKKPEVIVVDDEKEENHEAEEKVSAAKSQARRPVTRGLCKQVGSEEPTQPNFVTNDLVNGETPAKEAKKGSTRSVGARSTREKKDKSIALEDNLGTEENADLQDQVSEETVSLDQCKTEVKMPVDIPYVISAVVDGCIGSAKLNQDASRGDSSIDISQASFGSTAKKAQAAGSSDDLPSLCGTLTSPKSCGNTRMLFVKQTANIVYGTESKEANGESHYVVDDCKDLVGMVNHEADHDEVSVEADFVELEMKGEEHASLEVEFPKENCSSEEGIEGCEEVKSIECQSVEQVDDFIETKEEHYSSDEKVGCMVNQGADHDEVFEEADSVELEMIGEERAPLKVEFPEEDCSSEKGIEGCEEVKSIECQSVEQVDDFIETKEEHYSSNEKVGCSETDIMSVERSENEFTKADCEAYEEVAVMKCQSIEQADECEDMKADEIPDAFVLSPEKHFLNKDVESDEFGTSTFGELNHIVTNCASEIHVEDNVPTSPLYTDLLPQNEMLQKKQIEVLTTETHIEGDVLELLPTVDVDNASSIHEVCKTDGADMVDDGILNAAADLPNSIGDHSVNPEGFERKENALESIEVTLTNSSAGSHVDCRIAIVQESFQQPDQILHEGGHGVQSMVQVDALIIEEEKTVCKVNLEGKSLRQIKKMAKERSKICAERPESTCGEFHETPKQVDLFADSQGTKDADSQCARLAEEMHHKCNLVDKENMLEDKSLKDLKKILKEKLALRRKDNEAPTTVVRGLSENKSRSNIQAQH